MAKKALGTYDIAKICHVAPITVGRWMEEGKLPFFTTGGGHRRVWQEDLVKFLKSHNYPIPKNIKLSVKPVILIVEDDQITRHFIRKGLEKILGGPDIHEASSGYEAGELISTLTPALVVLDIMLPGIDGFEVCKRIRANKAHKGVKILAVSGLPSAEVKTKILKAGADDYLPKPFEMESLIKAVTKLLGIPA